MILVEWYKMMIFNDTWMIIFEWYYHTNPSIFIFFVDCFILLNHKEILINIKIKYLFTIIKQQRRQSNGREMDKMLRAK